MVDSTRQSHCECITPYRGIPSETRKRGKKLGGVPDTYEFNLPDEHKTHRSVAAREVSDVGLGLDAKKKIWIFTRQNSTCKPTRQVDSDIGMLAEIKFRFQ